MAQKVQVILTDDLSGKPIDDGQGRTVAFGFEGVNYEIDLSTANAEKLEKALSVYIEAGRKLSRSGKAQSRSTVASDASAIRAWAASNGIEVPARGRIPQSVRDQYNAQDKAGLVGKK